MIIVAALFHSFWTIPNSSFCQWGHKPQQGGPFLRRIDLGACSRCALHRAMHYSAGDCRDGYTESRSESASADGLEKVHRSSALTLGEIWVALTTTLISSETPRP